MQIFRMTFFPSGDVEPAWIPAESIDPDFVAPFHSLFATELSFESATPQSDDVKVKWTGADSGQALFTCMHKDRPFLSGALVAGADPEGDENLLGMFTRSLKSLDQELISRLPFDDILSRSERPLLAP